MRITGGELNGRILGSAKGWNIRPTSSKVRQAVFNIIGNDISGLSVIDFFAGSGIMGIEALSRGGVWALFIDNSNRSIAVAFSVANPLRRSWKPYHPSFPH